MRTYEDLKIMQQAPLTVKIQMTKQRIKEWIDEFGEDGVYVSFSGGKDSTVLKHIVDSMIKNGDIGSVPTIFINTGLEYPELQRFVREIKAGKYECFNSDIEIIKPKMRFDEVIKKYGYPIISKEVSSTVSGARKSIKKHVYSHRLCKLGVSRDEYGGLYDSGIYNYDEKLKGSIFLQRKWRYLLDVDFDISHYCCDVMKKKPVADYEKQTGRKPILGIMANESKSRYAKWLKQGCNAFNAKNKHRNL